MVSLQAEHWLFDRLRAEHVDVYVDGPFGCLRDRIAHVIIANRLRYAIAGHHQGKRETYARAFERLYGISLPSVPRETQLNSEVST